MCCVISFPLFQDSYADLIGHSSVRVLSTDNPLYTDTRYNDKVRYNDN